MGEKINYREASKKSWVTSETTSTGFPGLDHVNAGSLQRIADASEIMAKRYTDLLEERDRYKRYYEAELTAKQARDNMIRTYKGTVTKRNKEIKRLEAELRQARAVQQG